MGSASSSAGSRSPRSRSALRTITPPSVLPRSRSKEFSRDDVPVGHHSAANRPATPAIDTAGAPSGFGKTRFPPGFAAPSMLLISQSRLSGALGAAPPPERAGSSLAGHHDS